MRGKGKKKINKKDPKNKIEKIDIKIKSNQMLRDENKKKNPINKSKRKK